MFAGHSPDCVPGLFGLLLRSGGPDFPDPPNRISGNKDDDMAKDTAIKIEAPTPELTMETIKTLYRVALDDDGYAGVRVTIGGTPVSYAALVETAEGFDIDLRSM